MPCLLTFPEGQPASGPLVFAGKTQDKNAALMRRWRVTPSTNLSAQQRRFERWQHTYNHERPHEALDQHPPAEFYQASARRLGENDKPLVYPSTHEIKVVSESGHLAHEGRHYHVGDAFAGKRVGLHLNPSGQTDLYFANVHLGHLAFDSEGGRFKPTAYIAPVRRSKPAASGGGESGEGAKLPPQHPFL